jgi:hypothetical protein
MLTAEHGFILKSATGQLLLLVIDFHNQLLACFAKKRNKRDFVMLLISNTLLFYIIQLKKQP